MSQATVLKLVDSLPFSVEEDYSLLSSGDRPHSLHSIVAQPRQMNPDLAGHLINSYSKKDDVLLDPFCGTGTIALEACLRGRKVYASDASELQSLVTAAKLAPADIAEVTLKLQMMGLERPVSTESYQDYFAPFFDLDTFRELSNLRRSVSAAEDRVSRYILTLGLGLLHGHSGGYFSAYTSPKVSLLPEEQVSLNAERSQYPDYRSIIPRIIKRGAGMCGEGFAFVLQ
ncbi:MAG: hypothetical protein KDD62_11870, partial [Bdellovibrionales bacterium]|nr:hypothetical protein [Bdellovibrionales bacterium]